MSLRSRVLAVAGTAIAVFFTGTSIVHAAPTPTPVPMLSTLDDNIGEYTPSSSYDRDLFGGWLAVSNQNSVGWDANEFPSCNVREASLVDAGDDVVVGAGCDVVSGVWSDPYVSAPTRITNSSTLDLDHVVPLAHAWRSGADRLNRDDLRKIANDRDNLMLTSASVNRSKGDQAIDSWFPERHAKGYCDYASKYATIVDRYDLTIDQSEYDQINRMYRDCGFTGTSDPSPFPSSMFSSW